MGVYMLLFFNELMRHKILSNIVSMTLKFCTKKKSSYN